MSSANSLQSAQPASKADPSSLDGDEDDGGEAERNFQPRSLKFWMIIISIYLCIFLVALDRIIIATAIPYITNDFHSIDDIGWYGSAYMLTAAIFDPLFGRIYQLYSTKWVLLASILLFEVGSALCGAAPSSTAFIIGRAIAGIGAAGIFCGGIMIIVELVPLRRRPVFTSFFGMAFGISSVLGPLIGGTFSDSSSLTWRWCFYINLPIGGFTFVAILLFLHLESRPREQLTVLNQLKRLDPLGLLFFAPSMLCLVLAIQWGGTIYPWSAPRIIGLLVTFAVLFIAFVVVEVLIPETAMAPMRVVLNRSVAGSMLFVFLVSGGMMLAIYYLSVWFQAVQGQSAMEAGVRIIPMFLSLVLMGIAAAIFAEKVGYYVPAMLLSPCLCAVGAGLLSTLKPSAGSGQWISYQIIYGAGIGCGFQTAQLPPQTVLPRADVPLGTGLMFFMQQLGGAIFLAIGQNIFSTQLVDKLSGIAGLDAEAVFDAGATAYRGIVPPGDLNAVIHVYGYALTRTFILAAALSACMIVGAGMVEWRSIKEKKDDTSGPNETKEEGGTDFSEEVKSEIIDEGKHNANEEDKSKA